MMEKMWQCSELNRGTGIKKGCDLKMQNTCFEHEMFDVTTRPRKKVRTKRINNGIKG